MPRMYKTLIPNSFPFIGIKFSPVEHVNPVSAWLHYMCMKTGERTCRATVCSGCRYHR